MQPCQNSAGIAAPTPDPSKPAQPASPTHVSSDPRGIEHCRYLGVADQLEREIMQIVETGDKHEGLGLPGVLDGGTHWGPRERVAEIQCVAEPPLR